MKFILKYFPEVTIKSKPVRKQFCKRLQANLYTLLKPLDESIVVQRQWDKMVVELPGLENSQSEATDKLGVVGESSGESLNEQALQELRLNIIDVLSNTTGIAYFLEVVSSPLTDLQEIYKKTHDIYADQLVGKTFVVRCKRVGKHDFNSQDVERFVGGNLLGHCDTGGVSLKNPDLTVRLEIRDDTLFVVKQRYKGLGGFPMGSIGEVVSLVSGGFDSTVASYLTMKRGLKTHFCFFNLGGRAHEVGVKEVALYLWQKYGASHRVQFVCVPFEDVVAEILTKVDNSQMGVVLKRMMLRAGSRIADELGVEALVTGDAVAQVSSQTLVNMAVIDSVCERLVMRPLVAIDKTDIIKIAAEIGTEGFSAAMPEYCGVISVKPTTRAKPEKIAAQEQRFDFDVLEKAIANARTISVDEIIGDELSTAEVEILSVPVQDSIIIDVRHPNEEERKPLRLDGVTVKKIPFYALRTKFESLDQSCQYLLFCDKGTMSRLHASHLKEQGYENVNVYWPTT